MLINQKLRDEVIELLAKRAKSHRRVSTTTLAASCIVFIIGVGITYYWTSRPLSELQGLENQTAVLIASNSLKILSLAAIYYLGYLLASVYRHNIRLSGHYISRSYTLKLLSPDTHVPFEFLANFLDPNLVPIDKLPTWGENRPLPSNSKK